MSDLRAWGGRVRRGLGALARRTGLRGSTGSSSPQSTTGQAPEKSRTRKPQTRKPQTPVQPEAPKATPQPEPTLEPTGPAEPAPPPPPPTEDQVTARRLGKLSDSGQHEEALALAEQEFARIAGQDEPEQELIKAIQTTAAKAGAISLHMAVLQRRIELSPRNKLLPRQLRLQEGRWKESDPGWLPTIDPEVLADLSPRPSDRKRTGTILHLLKIGMPQRQSGYSMRSMYTLIGQARAGLDPVAVTALDFPRNIGVQDAPEVDEVGGVRYVHLLRDPIPERETSEDYLGAYATALVPVVVAEDPDLIHVHSGNRGTEAALVALAVGRALGIPVVYEVRGFFEALWTKDTAWGERAELYDRRIAASVWAQQEAASVITLSESMKSDIVGRGIDPDHVHVVPNGVDPTSFVPRERDRELTERLGLTDRFVFGYVSNLDHHREGQELLIDAALELRRRGVPATALIVGEGSRREVLEQHARDVDAGDAVLFTGRIPHDEVGDYYAQLDVFVVPRIDERAARLVTPLKPYEAMALGIPLVVSDLPALQEITGDGQRGETFRTGDALSLADVLEQLARDPARREELAAGARQWVLDHRSWSHNEARYAAVYDAVLGPNNAR
ncbi:glycosyltransferase family 4 protein [Ornithinimicrobium faecis]|uniref:D-inositol 3-phosphate glycosyltransferase n=1 Tax=Ornithinimicrobium faecis TaxID=2934158 RepID=A0ABY4YVY8_9MICO|nr:glycosyltransferase family 4 protein [Ornithinimicrobium sp. HY1793]USQ80322.1 glycosyltransferase family 4 protein [Ornithinimicrobium sp. HY1793]